MDKIGRRRFLQFGGIGAGLGMGIPGWVRGGSRSDGVVSTADAEDRTIRLSGDGLGLSPAQYARLLTRLIDEKGLVQDTYSLGGVVEELERRFALLLGKERAVFLPTGTLANHLAVRVLAGGPSRVIVQEESHLYRDEGDCAQTLSGLTLLPQARGRATFTAEEVQQAIDQTREGRVTSRVSAVSIETPVRRRQGEFFQPAEIVKIAALARREGIRLHLDGARLFLQAPYGGGSVAELAKPFDTVYVSLYKYFNAPSGAILAGPRDLLDPMFHTRRMFGGGLYHVWPFAAVALHYLEGFDDRFARAARISEDFIRALGRHDAFAVERVPSGTNLFSLRLKGRDPLAFRQRLAAKDILLSAPQRDAFLVSVNETLNRTTAADLADAFVRALAD
jgi:threonine aldolase